ncbi:bacterio-opsin activator domain-containing protein [Natrarchaeobius sp. A-rgal3]|uniref:bacterio-opsin activator domain-containing protein n=1 Tax=Natrarchaeobius versutus TaxID=1679078 RepID=UPI00350F9CBB
MSRTTPTRDWWGPDAAIRLLFVDPDGESTDDVRAVFEDEYGIDVTVASRSEDVFRSLETVDCVVAAVRPGERGDLELLRAVHESHPQLPYVVFSEERIDDVVGDALAGGATDYLRADRTPTSYRRIAATITAWVASKDADGERAGPPVDVTDGTCLLDQALSFVAVGASFARLTGYERAELVGTSWTAVFADEETPRLEHTAEGLRSRESAIEEATVRRRDGETIPALVRLARTGPDRVVCTVFELADRAERAAASADTGSETLGVERRIRELQGLTETGAEPTTSEDVCDAVVDAVGNDRELVGASVYLYDDADDLLRRRSASSSLEVGNETLAYDEESTPAWLALIERESVLVADLLPRPAGPVEDPRRARGIVVPVGSHGILAAGAARGDELAPLDHALIRLAGAIGGALLDRLEDQHRLEACRRRVEDAASTTDRLADTVDLVRRVARVIGTAWTRDELEGRLCEAIAATDRYALVRIADVDEVSEEVRDRAWAGSEKRYLEALETDANALLADGEPMARTIERLDVQSVRRLTGEATDASWRRDAIARGYRSVVAVPLVFRERAYGGLAVYSDRPDAFDDDERELLGDVGEWVGTAIRALETKSALLDRDGIDLEFRVRDPGIQFLEWAQETGCTVEFEAVVARPDGSIRGFFTIEGASAETILELANRSPAVADTRLVSERDDRRLFECTLTEDSVVAHLLEYGAVVRTIDATEAAGRLVVTIPEDTSVREFVDVVSRLYPDSTLVRRQDREYVAYTEYGFLDDLEDQLTDRQLEALETAFASGYFDIPRETTGDAVAEILGISQPTFNHHLRVAQRKLLAMVLGDESDGLE